MDLDPENASTAQAVCNLVRCLLGAAALACLEVLIDSIGVGATFTMIAALVAGCLLLLIVERQNGFRWRQTRTNSVVQ